MQLSATMHALTCRKIACLVNPDVRGDVDEDGNGERLTQRESKSVSEINDEGMQPHRSPSLIGRKMMDRNSTKGRLGGRRSLRLSVCRPGWSIVSSPMT